MKVLLAGPISTSALREATGLKFEAASAGYAQTPVVPLASEMHRLGHEIHVVSLDPAVVETQTHKESRFTLTFCPLRAPPRCRTRKRALDLFAAEIRALEEVMRESAADIVHAHWTYEYAEAAVRARTPHLVTMHDLGWQNLWHFRDPYRFMRLVMKYRVMPRIKHLTVVAPFMVPKRRQYGYFRDVRVVPNGLAIPPAEHVTRDRPLHTPRLVCIGNRSRLKNVAKSIDALRITRSRFPNAELHLFGAGLDDEFAGREEGVVAHGDTPHGELMRFLEREATLLIHSSLLETFGMIIAEAKARCVPVIAGEKSGGVPWVCGSDGGCTLVDVTDATAIADAVIAFLDDQRYYRRAAVKARIDIEQRFAIRTVAEAYLSHYAEILSRG